MQFNDKFLYTGLDLAKLTYPKATEKYQRVCLHYTQGGSVAGAVSWWKTLKSDPSKPAIGAPYIIDRDGQIYRLWDPAKRWAWALGVDSQEIDSSTLSVECVNYGPLDNRNCPTIAPGNGPVIDPIQLSSPWRGVSRFQRWPDVQLKAIAQLVKYLCTQFSIPHQFPQPKEMDLVDVKKWGSYSGVISHHHLRKDKLDIGTHQTFPWGTLLVDWDK